MDEAPLLGARPGPHAEAAADLPALERASEAEFPAPSPAAAVQPERDELPVLRDAYLGAAAPGEEPPAAEDAAPPPAYSLRVLSSLLPAPLGAGVRVIPVEIKEAGSTVTSNLEEAAFPNPLAQESCCKFLSSQEAEDAASSSPKKDSSPMVICQLKGGTQVLCIDNSGTRELKALHLVPQYQDQNNCLQSDVSKPLTTLVGRFLPVPAKLNLITQQDANSSGCCMEMARSAHSSYQTAVGNLEDPHGPQGSDVQLRELDRTSPNVFQLSQLDSGALPAAANNAPAFSPDPTLPGPPKITLAGVTLSSWDTKSKKPCNCIKSQCLKLYCDCFASGDFCNNCNCNNCCNNLHHEIERFNAIKACLDRNPEAFQPKIGTGRLGDIKPRHNKGCNCKRSGCLKNYCECYEAKIMCSSICKCIDCKNYEESPERKTLMNMPNSMETGEFEGSHHLSPTEISELSKFRKDGQPSSCISWEVVEATCACLLAQGEEAEKDHCSQCLAEQMILEEFGRCLSQILHTEFKAKGLKIEPSTL